jgi:hypothetical protein
MRALGKGVEVDLACTLHVDGEARPALVGRWLPGLGVERVLDDQAERGVALDHQAPGKE